MPEAHEHLERAEHAQHAAGENKRIALLIAVLALLLSFSETLGKNAQMATLDANVKAADTWAFFQAKDIRRTILNTAAAQTVLLASGVTDPAVKAAIGSQVAAWGKTAARYQSDPKLGVGRVQLMRLARAEEVRRDRAMARYHHYELASAAFQVGIVLGSAAVITGMIALAWFGGVLGAGGLALLALGLLAPHALALL